LEGEMIEEQSGFRKGCSCVEAVFTLEQIIGKRKEHNLPLLILFIDYEKIHDNVNRDILWKIMENKIPNSLLKRIKFIYRNTKVSIKFSGDPISETVQINEGLREGCGLSQILFNVCINKILQEFKMVKKKSTQLTTRK
jgi:hypothetical protein